MLKFKPLVYTTLANTVIKSTNHSIFSVKIDSVDTQ